MKFISQNTLLFLTLVFLFSECKKGEEDPSVSLRTRKNRLTGEWRLAKGSASYTTDGYNESYTFDGTNLVLFITQSAYYYYGKYTLSLTIEKDGSFTFNENHSPVILEASGTWNFNTGVGESKKKEEVTFLIDKVKKGYTNGDHFFNRGSTHFVYKITELRKKQLTISTSGKIYTDNRGKYATFSTNYTFIQ